MSTATDSPAERARPNAGQILKWTVYGLLLVNWGFYFFEELEFASHTLRHGGSFLEWTREFATTIDELAWFGLLFMFELETYALSDETLEKRKVRWALHGVRLVLYVFLAHTVFARVSTVVDYEQITAGAPISSLCEVAGEGVSFGKNYHYTLIDAENCGELSTGSPHYYLDPTVVTDREGFELERKLVWVDLSDAVVWLLVIWAIELAVWLQNRDIAGGPLMVASHASRVFYAVLFFHAGFWAYHGHWVYAWDQFLWICGFWAIEMNLSDWREEIRAWTTST